jgi:DNA-binding transcriptional regulator of glucitol operon
MFSSKVLSILCIIAVICFAALIALQVVEMQHYSKNPSVWPAQTP